MTDARKKRPMKAKKRWMQEKKISKTETRHSGNKMGYGWMDGQTVLYRDARMHLKSNVSTKTRCEKKSCGAKKQTKDASKKLTKRAKKQEMQAKKQLIRGLWQRSNGFGWIKDRFRRIPAILGEMNNHLSRKTSDLGGKIVD